MNLAELMSMEVAAPMSFEPLPKGQYKVTVDDCTFGANKKDKPMFTIDYVVNESDHAARRVRQWYTIVTNNGLHWDLPKFCEASGNTWPDDVAARDEAYFNKVALDLIGKTATVTLDIREYESGGETRKSNDVKKVEWDETKAKKKSKASKIEL